MCRKSWMSDLPDKLIFYIFQVQKNKKNEIITNWLSLQENKAFLGNKAILEFKLPNELKLLVFQRYKIHYYFGWHPPIANVNQNRSGWWPLPIENSWIIKCTMDTKNPSQVFKPEGHVGAFALIIDLLHYRRSSHSHQYLQGRQKPNQFRYELNFEQMTLSGRSRSQTFSPHYYHKILNI